MQDFENGNLNIPPSFGEGMGMSSEFDYQAPGPIDNLVPVNLDTSIPSIPAIPTSSGIYDAGYDANNPFEFFTKTQETGATEEQMAFQAAKPYSFASGYKQTNFERYYNDSDNFYKLGFNPIANNEENYNANRTWYQDAWRGFSHIPHLGASFVKSGYRSLGDMFSGDFSFTDETGADEFAEIMAKYGSTKGGVTGFTSNLVLQSGIVAGIAADYIATEAALAGITALSEGVALPGAIAASTAKTAQLAKRIADLRKIASANTAREVYNTVRTAKLANIVDGGISAIGQGVKNLVPSTATNVANLIKGNSQITDLAQVTRGVGDFIKDVKQISYTTSEASLEGGQVKNEFIDKRIQEFINEKGYYPEQEDLNKIYEKAEDAGFTTGMINAPLIYLTNGITFDNLFKGGKNALVKSTDSLIAQSSKTGRKLIIDPVTGEARITAGLAENTKLALKGFVKPKEYLDFTRRYFAANLAEGIQETSQEIVSGASTDYFERLYRTPEAGGVATYLTDTYENLKAQASGQGIETFLSGFLMGGLSGIAGTIGNGAKRSVVQQYYERKDPEKYIELFDKETKRFNEIADEINEAIQKGNKILTPDFENLLVQIRAGADMVEALKSFDDKAFHDIKDAARFNAIYTSLETGKFNFLQQKLEDMKQMTGAELKEAFELSDNVTEEEAKKVLDVAIARASQIKSQYDQFSEYKNPFNPNKYTLESIKDPETFKQFATERIGYQGFEDARKVAVFSLHNVELVSKRLQDLSNNITEISNLGEIAFSDVLPLLSPTDLQTEIDILSQEIETAKGSQDQALKDQTEKKKKKLRSLEQFKKHFASIENIEDKTEIEKKRWLKDAFVKYMDELAEANNKTFIKADLEKAYTYFVDYLALNKDLGTFTKAVNALTDPIGFYAEVNRRIKDRETFEAKRNDYMKEAFQEFLNDAKTNELINYLDNNNFIIDKATIPFDLPKGYEAFKTFLLNDPDVKFIDQKTQRSFTKADPRFKTIEDLINEFDESIKTQEAAEAEAKKKEAEKAAAEAAKKTETFQQPKKKPVTYTTVKFDSLDPKVKEFAIKSFNELSDEQKGGATVNQYAETNDFIQRLNAFMGAFKNFLSATKKSSPVSMSSFDGLIVNEKPDSIFKYVVSADFAKDPRVAQLIADYGLEPKDVISIYKPQETSAEDTDGIPLNPNIQFEEITITDDDFKTIGNYPAVINLLKKLKFVKIKGETPMFTALNQEGTHFKLLDAEDTTRPYIAQDILTLLSDVSKKQAIIAVSKKEKIVADNTKSFKVGDLLEKRNADNKPEVYKLLNKEDNGAFLLQKLEKGRPVGNMFKTSNLEGYYLRGQSPSLVEQLPKASPNEVFTVYNSKWNKNPELKLAFEDLLKNTPKDELLKKINFKVKKNKVTNPVLNYFVVNPSDTSVINNRIAYQSEEYEIAVFIGDTPVGYLRNPSSFKMFNENGEPVSVDQLTSDLYNSIFFNNLYTLDAFQKTFYNFNAFVNELIEKSENKTEATIPYTDLKNAYGKIGTGGYDFLSGGQTTSVNDLDYKYVNDKNGIYLIDRFTNPETGQTVEQIITKNVSPQEQEEIRNAINQPKTENSTIYQDATRTYGRYVLVVKIPNGDYKFIELRPGKMDSAQVTELFDSVISEANRIKKDNVIYDDSGVPVDEKEVGVSKTINDRLKDVLFFALPKTSSGSIDLTIEITDRGDIQFNYVESWMKGANGRDYKIKITEPVKNLDDLLQKFLEKALARNLNEGNKLKIKLPGLNLIYKGNTVTQNIKQTKITKADVQKLKDTIRQGFPKDINPKNVENILSTMFTSVSSGVIKPGTLNINFGSSTAISAPGINVQGDGKSNTSLRDNSNTTKKPVTSTQSTTTDVKADIEKRRQADLIANYESLIGLMSKEDAYKGDDAYSQRINAKYDAELARELYKEIKAGKLITDMTSAEQEVANKYITEELRKSVDAELAALGQPIEAQTSFPEDPSTLELKDVNIIYKNIADALDSLIKSKNLTGKKSEREKVLNQDPEYIKLKKLKDKYFNFLFNNSANKDAAAWSKDDVDDLDVFIKWLQSNLPGGIITVDDTLNLNNKMLSGNVTVGQFYAHLNDINLGIDGIRGVIKTAKDAPFKYHEAFHAVFRLFLNDQEINYYLEQSKKELYSSLKQQGKTLTSAINDMIATNPKFYSKMTRSQLEKRLFEEHLADRFQEYKKLSDLKQQQTTNYIGIKGLFYKLANLIKSVLDRFTKNSVDKLFDRIDSAQFKAAKIQKNIFTEEALEYGITEPALKAILLKSRTNFIVDQQGNPIRIESYMSSADVINLTSSIAATVLDRFENNNPDKLSLGKLLEKTMDDYRDLYDSEESEAYANLPSGTLEEQRFLMFEEALNENYKELGDSVREHLAIIRKVKEITDDVLADSIKELEFGLRGADDFDKTAEQIGGFGNLPTYIKSFLATTTFRSADEFGNTELVEGEPLLQAIDAKAVYDGILNITAGSDSEFEFYKRLKSLSSNNPHMNAAVTRLFNEAGIQLNYADETITVNNPAKASVAMLFYKSMGYLQKTPYLTMLKSKSGKVKIFEANQKGAAKVQFSLWKDAFNNVFYTKYTNNPDQRDVLLNKASIALNTLKQFIIENDILDFSKKEILTDQDINDLAAEASRISQLVYEALGINFKADYIILSSLVANEFTTNYELNRSKYLTSEQGEYISALIDSSESIIENNLIKSEDITWLSSYIINGKNPFLKVEVTSAATQEDEATASEEEKAVDKTKIDTGAVDRIYRFAQGNHRFDETISSTTFSRENGDKIWMFQLPTFNRKILNRIKTLVADTQGVLKEKLEDLLRYNPLFNNPAFRQLVLSPQFTTKRASELKEATINSEGFVDNRLDSNKLSEAKPYKKFSPRDFVLYLMDLAANQVSFQNYTAADGSIKQSYRAPVLTRVLEASSTAEFVELPIIKAIEISNKKTVITKEFTNGITEEIARQFLRIQKVKKEIEEIEAIGKDAYIKAGGEVIENYHTGKKRGLDFSSSIKDLLKFEEGTLYDKLISTDTNQSIFSDNLFRQQLLIQISNYFNNEVDEFIDTLVETGVLARGEKGQLTNKLLSETFNNDNASINFRKGNLPFNIKQLFLNDYYNTLFYNNLTIGDETLGIKDAIDAFKRAKGMNAAYIDIATTLTAPYLGIDHASKKSNILVFKEPKVKSTNAGNKEIDRADGQTYTSVKGLRYTLWGLGRLNKELALFLNDIENGVPITSARYFGSKEVAGMFDYDAKFNSLKLVYYDNNQNYIKTSVFLLTKELTSNKNSEGKWEAKIGREFLHNLRERMEKFERENPETFTFASPESAVKMKKSNVFGESGEDITNSITDADNNYFTELNNNYWGLQTENPGGKKKITDPSQIKVIVQSELPGSEKINYLGKEVSIDELRKLYQLSSARKVELSYNQTINELFDFGDVQHELGKSIKADRITPKLEGFINYARQILESTGGSSQLINMFSVDKEGNPKYNLNNIISEGKFIEFFFSYFRSVTNQKVKGDSLTLVSDAGFNVVREIVKIYPNGAIETRIVPQTKLSKRKITKDQVSASGEKVGDLFTDRLKHNQAVYNDKGEIISTYAEVMVPPLSKDIMNYIAENGFAPDVITELFATRIPSQDKHSSQAYKIVDFLPVFYSSSVVAPAEMVEVTGHDFDVDKVYAMFKEFYTKKVKGKTEFIEYGKATGKQERFEEFLRSQFKNKTFRDKYREIEKGLEQQVDDELMELEEMGYTYEELEDMYDFDNLIDKDEVIKLTLKELGLPSTPEEYIKVAGNDSSDPTKQIVPEILHNNIVNLRRTFVSNPTVTVQSTSENTNPIAFDPADTQPFDNVIKEFETEFAEYPEFLELLKDANFDVNALSGKITGFANIMEGAEGIGPAVVMNTAYHFLNTYKISIKDYSDKVFNLQIGENTYTDFGGSVAGDARKAYLLSAIVTAMTDNAKLILASKFNLNPDAVGILSYMVALGVPFNKALKITSSNIIRKYYTLSKNSTSAFKNKEEENLYREKIIADLLKEQGEPQDLVLTDEDLNNGIKESDNKNVNYKLLSVWSELSKQSTYATKLANIIRISQGLGQNFEDLDGLRQDIEDLGLTLNGKVFNMSDETYDESSIPFNGLREAIKNKAFEVKQYIKVTQELDALSGFLFLRRTKVFKKLFTAIKQNFKVQRRFENKFNENLNKDLLSYFTLKVFLNNETKKGASSSLLPYLHNALIYKQLESEQEEGFRNINKIVADLKEKQPENNFLKFLNNVPVTITVVEKGLPVEKRNFDNKTNINYVERNTWATLTKAEIERMQLSIIDLYNDQDTRQDALALIAYLMVKDGLQFKAGSFLGVLPNELLDRYNNSVNQALDVLSKLDTVREDKQGEVFKSAFGASVEDVIKDFVINYSKNINNSFFIRNITSVTRKNFTSNTPEYYPGESFEKDSTDKVVKTGEGVIRDYTNPKSNDKYVIVDLWRGSVDKYAKMQDFQMDGVNFQQEIVESRINLEKLGDNKRFLSQSGFSFGNYGGKDVIIFPYLIKKKVRSSEDTFVDEYYELVSVTTSLIDPKAPKDLTNFIGKNLGVAFGSGATYRKTKQIGVKSATPIGFIFPGNIPTNEAIRLDLKNTDEAFKKATSVKDGLVAEEPTDTLNPPDANVDVVIDTMGQLKAYGIKKSMLGNEYFELSTGDKLNEFNGKFPEQVVSLLQKSGKKVNFEESEIADTTENESNIQNIQNTPVAESANPFGFTSKDIDFESIKGEISDREVDEVKNNCKNK